MKSLIVFLSILLLLIVGCKKDNNNHQPVLWKVTYNIGCTDCQVVYYKDSLENQQSENNQNSSWSYTFYGKKNQTTLLLAYNTSDHPQGVTATIMLNDTILESRTTYCAISGVSFVVDTLR
jgi:hypothetical protein